MWKAQATIEGLIPYKQNRITERTIKELEGTGGKKQTPAEVAKEWKNKVYKDKGGYYIPSSHLQGALNKGMCSPIPIKCNKVKLTREKAKGTIFVTGNGYLSNGKPNLEPTEDVNPISTRLGLVLQRRPIFKEGWKATFDIFIAQDWLTLDALRDGLIQAGTCHGVGSHRPTFGRFIVKDLKEIN